MMSKFAIFKESFYRCFPPTSFFCQVLVINKEIGWNIVLGEERARYLPSEAGYCLLQMKQCAL